jgi:hypothetical protein
VQQSGDISNSSIIFDIEAVSLKSEKCLSNIYPLNKLEDSTHRDPTLVKLLVTWDDGACVYQNSICQF